MKTQTFYDEETGDLRTPYIPPEVVEHLKVLYDITSLVRTAARFENNDAGMGYIRGVVNVIAYLASIVEDQKGE